MTTTFKELMSKLSEDELMDYLNNSDKYTAEAITEAVEELKRRGKIFTKEDLNGVTKKIQTSKEEEEDRTTFKGLMSRLSEDELMDYLNNSDKYTAEAITEAIDELKRRGKIFTKEELNELKIKIQTSKEEEEDEEENDFWHPSTRERNVVTDQNAPLLYSKGAIRGFSVVFSVIFGAVLLSSNINNRSKKLIVLGFGIAYTTITIFILNAIAIPNVNSAKLYWVLILNTAGGLGLTTTFWNSYIGKGTKYRTKPIWKPLIISILITVAFLLAFLYG